MFFHRGRGEVQKLTDLNYSVKRFEIQGVFRDYLLSTRGLVPRLLLRFVMTFKINKNGINS